MVMDKIVSFCIRLIGSIGYDYEGSPIPIIYILEMFVNPFLL